MRRASATRPFPNMLRECTSTCRCGGGWGWGWAGRTTVAGGEQQLAGHVPGPHVSAFAKRSTGGGRAPLCLVRCLQPTRSLHTLALPPSPSPYRWLRIASSQRGCTCWASHPRPTRPRSTWQVRGAAVWGSCAAQLRGKGATMALGAGQARVLLLMRAARWPASRHRHPLQLARAFPHPSPPVHLPPSPQLTSERTSPPRLWRWWRRRGRRREWRSCAPGWTESTASPPPPPAAARTAAGAAAVLGGIVAGQLPQAIHEVGWHCSLSTPDFRCPTTPPPTCAAAPAAGGSTPPSWRRRCASGTCWGATQRRSAAWRGR